jgi:hypothetical protein
VRVVLLHKALDASPNLQRGGRAVLMPADRFGVTYLYVDYPRERVTYAACVRPSPATVCRTGNRVPLVGPVECDT